MSITKYNTNTFYDAGVFLKKIGEKLLSPIQKPCEKRQEVDKMEQEIQEFIEYLHNTKNTSLNTEVSYQRDLTKMAAFLEMRDITASADVREFDLLG